MARIIFLSLLTLYTCILFGQSGFDLKEIQKLTNDSTSSYYYLTLISEFNDQPETFDSVKAKFLYYGKLYTKNYKMFQFTEDDKQFNNLIRRNKCQKAIPIGEKIVQEHPSNIEIISRLYTCYKKANLKGKADTALTKLTILMKTVFQSGTGQRMEDALKVVAIGDEYIIMAWLGVTGLSRQSVMKENSTIDSWKVKDLKSGKKSEMHFEWLVNLQQGTKNMKWPD